MASNKSDRSGSPSTLSEEGRRELIARQHRALYGPEGSGFAPQGQYGQESSGHEQGQQQQPGQGAMRGPSPRGMDPFGMPGQSDNMQQQSNDSKTTSPPNHQHGKAPSPTTGEESNHSRTISKSNTVPSVGTIGRPSTQQHMPAQSLNKRTTSPLPSSLNYGFGSSDQSNDRIPSNNSNNNSGQEKNSNPAVSAWGTGSGVWGNKLGAGVWS